LQLGLPSFITERIHEVLPLPLMPMSGGQLPSAWRSPLAPPSRGAAAAERPVGGGRSGGGGGGAARISGGAEGTDDDVIVIDGSDNDVDDDVEDDDGAVLLVSSSSTSHGDDTDDDDDGGAAPTTAQRVPQPPAPGSGAPSTSGRAGSAYAAGADGGAAAPWAEQAAARAQATAAAADAASDGGSCGRYVLYWLKSALRAHENPALDVAAAAAARLGVPLLVAAPVLGAWPHATLRRTKFVLEGAPASRTPACLHWVHWVPALGSGGARLGAPAAQNAVHACTRARVVGLAACTSQCERADPSA
jgi:hypothetical protein